MVPAFGIFTFLAVPLTALWLLMLGGKLYRYGRGSDPSSPRPRG